MAVAIRALLLVVLVVLIAALVIGLKRHRSLNQIQNRQVIRIGYTVEVPHAYRDDTGLVTGWRPELARQIDRPLDIAWIEWIRVRFAELLPGLVENRFDVAAVGLFVTPSPSPTSGFPPPDTTAILGVTGKNRNGAVTPFLCRIGEPLSLPCGSTSSLG